MTLDLTQSLPSHVRATSGRPVEDSTLMEVWQGLSAAIVDQIADNWAATTERYAKGRQEHYFSAEFLMGRALLHNLSNLGLVEKAREALAAYGLDLAVDNSGGEGDVGVRVLPDPGRDFHVFLVCFVAFVAVEQVAVVHHLDGAGCDDSAPGREPRRVNRLA